MFIPIFRVNVILVLHTFSLYSVHIGHNLIIMFSSKSYLEKKTGPYGIGRLSYLQSLVVEYQDTSDLGMYILTSSIF